MSVDKGNFLIIAQSLASDGRRHMKRVGHFDTIEEAVALVKKDMDNYFAYKDKRALEVGESAGGSYFCEWNGTDFIPIANK